MACLSRFEFIWACDGARDFVRPVPSCFRKKNSFIIFFLANFSVCARDFSFFLSLMFALLGVLVCISLRGRLLPQKKSYSTKFCHDTEVSS